MTLSHEDANARLLDLVYGEAAPAERLALEAHVATCARCQVDLEALGDTRARVRVALDDQPPPAGAHARILAAAAVEASNGAQAGAAATAPPAKGNEPASRAARQEEQPSFWERLRGRWTFPTLATLGAVAVAALVLGPKVFTNPQQTLERGQQPLFPSQENAPATTAAPAPSPAMPAETPPPAEAMAREAQAKLEAAKADEHKLSPQARARIEAVRRYNKPRSSVGGLMGSQPSFSADKLGGAPASQAIGGLRPDGFGTGSGRGGVTGPAGAAAPAPAEKKPAKGSLDDLLEGGDTGGNHYASPPAGWKKSRPAAPAAAAPPPPPAPKPALSKRRDVADNPLEGLGGGGASSERSHAEPRAEEAPSSAKSDESLSKHKSVPAAAPEAEAPAPAAVPRAFSGKAAEAPAEAKKEKDAAPAPYEALAKHADELYAAGRWAEAAAAYNDLLRRFPKAEPAVRWRSRLGVAQREAAPKSAPATAPKASKKSVSDDALEGL